MFLQDTEVFFLMTNISHSSLVISEVFNYSNLSQEKMMQRQPDSVIRRRRGGETRHTTEV